MSYRIMTSANAPPPPLSSPLPNPNIQELAQHPSIRAILDYKWRTFARWLFLYVLSETSAVI